MGTGERARRLARRLCIALALAGLPLGALGSERPLSGVAEPFDLPATGGLVISYSALWRELAHLVDLDRSVLARCRTEPDQCPSGARHLLSLVETARAKDGRARLGEINRAVNLAIRYQSDAARHGAPDGWASPLATFASGAGDCEDYAIAKYLALREAGVPADDLRLVVVRDTRLGQDHAVLAARLDDRWLVLDNRRFLLLEDRDVHDYVGLTSFGS